MNYIRAALTFAIGIYVLCAIVLGLSFGLMFGAEGGDPKPFTRRIHYVFPTYALGYWLAQPMEADNDNTAN